MKHVIMAAALIPACFILACGTKKREKQVPVVFQDQSADATINPDSTKNTDCAMQTDCSPSAIEQGRLLVVDQNSWLNPQFDRDGVLLSNEGLCLEKFTASIANQDSRAQLDMSLSNMEMKNNSARCLMQVQVAFKKGYAFAIRKIEVPVTGRIPVDSNAVFEGFYGFKGKKAVAVHKVLESRYSEKPLRLDHTVADQDIVWSSCSGQATLVVDTGMSLNFSAEALQSDLRIEGDSPYRLEIVWAKCL